MSKRIVNGILIVLRVLLKTIPFLISILDKSSDAIAEYVNNTDDEHQS